MVIHKTRKKYKFKKRKSRRRKKYISIGGSLKKNFVADEKQKLKEELESLKELPKEKRTAKAKLAFEKYIDQIKMGLKDIKKGDVATGLIWTIGSLTLGLIPLLYRIGVGAVLAPTVRKSVRYFISRGKKSDLKKLEQLEKLEPILKNIDKDIKNNMSLKQLKNKYIEADFGKDIKSKGIKGKIKKTIASGATSLVKATRINQALKSDLLLPYIYYKLSNTNKAKASKLENKSGNLFYKVNITKDGILKFNTAGPLIAPSYKVSNLFTRGKFTTWGGKKRRRRTKRRRTRKRTKRN